MNKPNSVYLQRALVGIEFPCDHDGLVAQAVLKGVDDRVMRFLRGLPHQTFDGADDVVRICAHTPESPVG